MSHRQFPFTKYVGCGNDFILVDNRRKIFPHPDPKIVQSLCHRQNGIGADGLILLETSSKADYRMRIFNADGSEAEMCGNGIRCLMRFIKQVGDNKNSCVIETKERVLKLTHLNNEICVEMGMPQDIQWNLEISFNNEVYKTHFLNTGVPHCVLFFDQIDSIDLNQLGPFFRHHSIFGSKGTNVNIAQIIDKKKIKIRTFERGVEGETLACGTGATAVALAASSVYQLEGPIEVKTKLGDILTIAFNTNGNQFNNVTMTGPAKSTFHGILTIKND